MHAINSEINNTNKKTPQKLVHVLTVNTIISLQQLPPTQQQPINKGQQQQEQTTQQ